MGRPRKKKHEETLQTEDTVISEEEVTVIGEPEAEGEGTERVAAVIEPSAEEEAAAIVEPPAEAAVAEADLEAPEPVAVEEPTAVGEPPAVEATPKAAPEPKKPKAKKAEKKPKRKRVPAKARERKQIVRLPKPEHARGRRKERRGVVVSSAMDKTIVVRVETVKPDRRYKKVVRRSAKFHAHDEQNAAHVGDLVRIVETRPLSKTKNWRLAEVVEQAR